MCIKKILQVSIIVILAIFSNIVQADLPKNAVYVELGGNVGGISLNYEKKINPNIGARIGVGYSDPSLLTFPLMIFKLWGEEKSKHHFETALGVLYVGHIGHMSEKYVLKYKINERHVAGVATLGYRYSPEKKGLVFRIGLTPIFSERAIATGIGISLGYVF